MTRLTGTRLTGAVVLALASTCAAADDPPGQGVVQLEWPASVYDRNLAAYVAASLVPVGSLPARPTLAQRLAAPPFVTGEGRVALDLTALDDASADAFRQAATATPAGRVLSWDTFLPVAEQRYFDLRYFSANLPALHEYLALPSDPAWVSVRLRSIISGGERRVWFHVRKVLEATLSALESRRPLLYPTDTWFVAEHLDAAGKVTETHVTGKRPDWEWDYGLYDKDGIGQIVSHGHRTETRAPSSCYSCHEISARVSPFAEFPAAADPVGDLHPAVLVTLSPADSEIVRKLGTEKGADQVMGQYGGLAALQLRAWRRAGTAPAWSAPLWDRLLKLVPALGR